MIHKVPLVPFDLKHKSCFNRSDHIQMSRKLTPFAIYRVSQKEKIPEPTVNISVSYYPSLMKFLQCVPLSILRLCATFHPYSTISTHVMKEKVKVCISPLTEFFFLCELIRWFTETGGSHPLSLVFCWWARDYYFYFCMN